jgi:uncharacterized protein Yka (UPF0111/DUF47 family)
MSKKPANPFNNDEYRKIPRDKFSEIPVNTRISYVYQVGNKPVYIKSGFVQQHLLSMNGTMIMCIKVGSKVWNNQYSDIKAIYYNIKDHEKIKDLKKNAAIYKYSALNLSKKIDGINAKVEGIESKVDRMLRRSV